MGRGLRDAYQGIVLLYMLERMIEHCEWRSMNSEGTERKLSEGDISESPTEPDTDLELDNRYIGRSGAQRDIDYGFTSLNSSETTPEPASSKQKSKQGSLYMRLNRRIHRKDS